MNLMSKFPIDIIIYIITKLKFTCTIQIMRIDLILFKPWRLSEMIELQKLSFYISLKLSYKSSTIVVASRSHMLFLQIVEVYPFNKYMKI